MGCGWTCFTWLAAVGERVRRDNNPPDNSCWCPAGGELHPRVGLQLNQLVKRL